MTNHPNRSKQQQAKHTPGPWVDMGLCGHPDGDNGEFHEIQFHTGTPEGDNRSFGHVCDVHVLATNEHARGIAKANARLIAAAPELLAALKHATAMLQAASLYDAPGGNAAREQHRAAIAKAEGK